MSPKPFSDKEELKNLATRVNYKRLIGLLILITGIVLFIYSVHATKQIADANNLSQNISDFFENNPSTWNPVIKFFGGKAQEKIDYYSHVLLMVQIGSVVLTALGAVMIFACRNKKK